MYMYMHLSVCLYMYVRSSVYLASSNATYMYSHTATFNAALLHAHIRWWLLCHGIQAPTSLSVREFVKQAHTCTNVCTCKYLHVCTIHYMYVHVSVRTYTCTCACTVPEGSSAEFPSDRDAPSLPLPAS